MHQRCFCFAVWVFVSLCCTPVLQGAVTTEVVLTGDSITGGGVGYADEFSALLPDSTYVGRGGLTADGYVNERDTVTGLNYAEQVADLNPDTIVFMLGINDAMSSDVSGSYFQFYRRLSTAFDTFDMSTASHVLILSILPIDETLASWVGAGVPGTNDRVNGTGGTDPTDVSFGYNSWLQREVGLRNGDGDASPIYQYIDLNSGFSMNYLDTDGLHLTDMNPSNDPVAGGGGKSGSGQPWLANAAFASVTAVPEPSPVLSICFLLAGLAVSRSIRRAF